MEQICPQLKPSRRDEDLSAKATQGTKGLFFKHLIRKDQLNRGSKSFGFCS